MSQLIYSETTAPLLAMATVAPPQALLLTGPVGIGLATAARHIANTHLEGVVQPTDRDGAIDNSRKGIIRAEQIRELVKQSITKSQHHRIYIIDDADRMNHTAQNAFLKILEEPIEQVSFILTSHTPHRLLATIRSRVQALRLDPISRKQSELVLTKHKVLDGTARQQMLFLASGLPAELSRLATNQAYFTDVSSAIRDARTFLQGDILSKFQLIERYQNDRARTLTLLVAVERILRHSLTTSKQHDAVSALDRLSVIYDRVAANGNIRLQLISFLV